MNKWIVALTVMLPTLIEIIEPIRKVFCDFSPYVDQFHQSCLWLHRLKDPVCMSI